MQWVNEIVKSSRRRKRTNENLMFYLFLINLFFFLFSWKKILCWFLNSCELCCAAVPLNLLFSSSIHTFMISFISIFKDQCWDSFNSVFKWCVKWIFFPSCERWRWQKIFTPDIFSFSMSLLLAKTICHFIKQLISFTKSLRLTNST